MARQRKKGLASLIQDTREPTGPKTEAGSAAGPSTESGPRVHPVAGRKLRRIAVADIETPPPRIPLRGADGLEELKASLETKGQYFPILVRHHGERYQLVSGFRRLEACRELGRDSVLAIVYEEISEREAEELYVMDNLAGHDVEPLALWRLVQAHGVDALTALTVPASRVGGLALLDQAAPTLRELFEAGRINLGQAMTLHAVGDPELVGETVAQHLMPRQIKERAEERHLERLAAADPGDERITTDVDDLAGHVGSAIDSLTDKLEILRRLQDRLSQPRREELQHKLARFDAARRAWREPAAGEEALVLGFKKGEAVRRLAPEAFDSEVLQAEAPVLLSLQLDDPTSSRKAENALEVIRQSYDGELQLYSMNPFEADLDDLPRMVQLGREFIVKSLPAFLLYWRGHLAGSSAGEVDAERWVRVIREEVTRRRPV